MDTGASAWTFAAILESVALHWPLVATMLAAGLFAGFVAGLFGIGGGFVVVPTLAAIFGAFGDGGDHIMHVAIGTSLATIVFTSLVSVRAHARRGAVDLSIIRSWTIWVASGAVAGVALTRLMDASALKLAFGAGVFVMGLHFLFPVLGKRAPKEERLPTGPMRALLGSGLGAFSAMLGIGGGTPAVLIMTTSGVAIHRAVATAAGFGAMIAIPAALASVAAGWNAPDLPFGSLGFVNVVGLAAIAAMSVLTAPLGAAAAHKLDAVALKKVFGLYLVATSAWMLWGGLAPALTASAS